MVDIANRAQEKAQAENPSDTRFTVRDKNAADQLTEEDKKDIRIAFERYDRLKTGVLDGSKLRMALRELGFNTADAACHKWATSGKSKAGISLKELERLIGSGKLGHRVIKEVQGMNDGLTDNVRMAQLAKKAHNMIKKKKDDVEVHLHERRYALTPNKDAGAGLPVIDIPGMAKVAAPKLDGNNDMSDQISVERRRELKEVFEQFDQDKSGFLQPDELNNALKALGLHFDEAAIVRTCHKYGGVLNMAAFSAVASTQIHYQDQLLEVHDFFMNGGEEDEHGDRSRNSLASLANVNEHGESRKQYREAYHHMRATACTNKNRKWRSLLFTTHSQIGEHGTGLRLYFDLLLLLSICFGVLSVVNMSLLFTCYNSKALIITLRQTRSESRLEIPAKMTVGNLPRMSEDAGRRFAAADAFGIQIVIGLLIAFNVLWMPRVIRGSHKAGRLEDLAVIVDKLPKELPDDIHCEYKERLEVHFNHVFHLRDKEGDEVSFNPVQEVVVCRDYYGAISGVLKQVQLLKRAKYLDARMTGLRAKYKELAALLGIDTDKRRDSNVSVLSGFSDDSDVQKVAKPQPKIKVTAVVEKRKRMMEARIAKVQRKREAVEEKMLEIETARGEHADMKAEERDVHAAYVVFSSDKTRDRILKSYRGSSFRCCRKYCQGKPLRFGNRLEEDLPSSEDESAPIRVREAIWQAGLLQVADAVHCPGNVDRFCVRCMGLACIFNRYSCAYSICRRLDRCKHNASKRHWHYQAVQLLSGM